MRWQRRHRSQTVTDLECICRKVILVLYEHADSVADSCIERWVRTKRRSLDKWSNPFLRGAHID
jgi:hypothetical protein